MLAASPLRVADGETAPVLPAGRSLPLASARLTLGAWLDAQTVEGEAAPALGEEPLEIQAPDGPVPPERLERPALVLEDAPEEVDNSEDGGPPAEHEAASLSRDELESALIADKELWAARSDALERQVDALRGALSRVEAEQESARALALHAAEQAAVAAQRERSVQANLAALGGELLRMASAFDQRMARYEAALEAALGVSEPGPGIPALAPPELGVPEPAESGALLLEDDLDIAFAPPEPPPATPLQDAGEPLELSVLASWTDPGQAPSDPPSIPPVSTDKGGRRGFWGLRTALAASGVVAASAAPLAAAGEAAAHPPVSITASMSFEAVAPDPQLSRVTALQQQADRGVLGAQLALAELFEEGRVVKRDLAAARTWTARAAEAGAPDAMHNLALLWLEGVGGPRSEQQALVWFERAARCGVAESAYNLARLSGKKVSGEKGSSRAS